MSIIKRFQALDNKKSDCMRKNYTGYNVDRLLDDDCFIQWLLFPDTGNERIWNELRERDEELGREIDAARSFVVNLRRDMNLPEFSPDDEIIVWEAIKTKNSRYGRRNKKFRMAIWVTGVAALICLCLFSLHKYYLAEKWDVNYMAMIAFADSTDESSRDVELVLSEDKKITITDEKSQVEYVRDGEVNVNSRKVYSVAKEKGKDNTRTFNQLIVPHGKRSSITFSDGTRIWVNSGSKVVYPVAFNEKKREIYIQGEVFLDVTRHDDGQLFVVKTQHADVKVLGTRFNVCAYKDEPNLQVTLEEGKVEVRTPGDRAGLLSPSQQLDYDIQSDKTSIRTVNLTNYTTWKDGYYQFEKQPLEFVFKRLSRYYGVRIEWDEAVGKLSCSGKLDLKDELNDVLNNLRNVAPILITYGGDFVKISLTI